MPASKKRGLEKMRRVLAIIILILILTSHFDTMLYVRVRGGEANALAALKEIEEELERGQIPSGSITEANFIIPEGFPADLAKRLWLFVAQLVSEGYSKDGIQRAMIDANDTLELPSRISYEFKNYTIIPKYDEIQVCQSNDGSVSVEIPYSVVDIHGKDVDADSIKYESNGTNLFHILYRYPKRRTYLVRVIDPDAYTLTFIDLKTGKVFNKTVRMNIGLFSNLTQGNFGFESFIIAVPGHFEETREAVESQVCEFRVLLPAHDPLVVDTGISSTKVKVGDVITISAQIRNPQEAKGFRVLLGARFSDEEAFEAWAPPPVGFSYGSGCPASYLYLRAKRPGVYRITIYFAVVEPKSLDVVFWNGGKTVTYVITVLPEAPKLRVELEAKALAKFANLTITLVNTGGQEARDVKLFVTGDVEEKQLDVGRVWHTWEGNVITKLLTPIAKVNVTAVYYDLEGRKHANTALITISTTNFVTPEEWRTYLVEVEGYEETKRVFVPSYQGATHVKPYLMKNCLAPPSMSFFDGLSLIPISPNGFTLTLGNASNIAEIFPKVPEVRYMLLDVKPRFLCERVLREDEVKKLFHLNEDERLEPSRIPPGYEVKLVKEEVLNQSEIVTVSDDLYEQLKHSNWEDYDYKYEDTGVKKWDLNKATTRVPHGKTIELVYRPLTCRGDLVKGVLVKNYAARNMAYELEVLQGPIVGVLPKSSVLSIPAYGSIPMNIIQLESASPLILIRLKYGNRIISTLLVSTAGKVSEFWKGFWDGVKEKLPGIIITATVMIILAIPTAGGSLLHYVKKIVTTGVLIGLMVGTLANVRELFDAYSTYAVMDKVAEEFEGFSQRASYFGYMRTYSFFQRLKEKVKESQLLVMENTGLDLLADITVRDIFIAFGREDATEYEKGRAIGRLVGAAASLIEYEVIFYKFLSHGPKLLSLGGKIKEVLRGIYNWLTPAIWDLGALLIKQVRARLVARRLACMIAIFEQSEGFTKYLGSIGENEPSIKSVLDNMGSPEDYVDRALEISGRLGLREETFFSLIRAYGESIKNLGHEKLEKFLKDIQEISSKDRGLAEEFLKLTGNIKDSELLKKVITEIIPKFLDFDESELTVFRRVLINLRNSESTVKLLDGYLRILSTSSSAAKIIVELMKELDAEEMDKAAETILELAELNLEKDRLEDLKGVLTKMSSSKNGLDFLDKYVKVVGIRQYGKIMADALITIILKNSEAFNAWVESLVEMLPKLDEQRLKAMAELLSKIAELSPEELRLKFEEILLRVKADIEVVLAKFSETVPDYGVISRSDITLEPGIYLIRVKRKDGKIFEWSHKKNAAGKLHTTIPKEFKAELVGEDVEVTILQYNYVLNFKCIGNNYRFSFSEGFWIMRPDGSWEKIELGEVEPSTWSNNHRASVKVKLKNKSIGKQGGRETYLIFHEDKTVSVLIGGQAHPVIEFRVEGNTLIIDYEYGKPHPMKVPIHIKDWNVWGAYELNIQLKRGQSSISLIEELEEIFGYDNVQDLRHRVGSGELLLLACYETSSGRKKFAMGSTSELLVKIPDDTTVLKSVEIWHRSLSMLVPEDGD
ncbi:MAG: hypothetical protein FGF50_09355, partial [Candidatus Brockarchaeota archaeon]|nr:hypothetical protein [Candidatus Brockarchaeota archaeon]